MSNGLIHVAVYLVQLCIGGCEVGQSDQLVAVLATLEHRHDAIFTPAHKSHHSHRRRAVKAPPRARALQANPTGPCQIVTKKCQKVKKAEKK